MQNFMVWWYKGKTHKIFDIYMTNDILSSGKVTFVDNNKCFCVFLSSNKSETLPIESEVNITDVCWHLNSWFSYLLITSLICFSWSTKHAKFHGLMIQRKNTQIGSQQTKIYFNKNKWNHSIVIKSELTIFWTQLNMAGLFFTDANNFWYLYDKWHTFLMIAQVVVYPNTIWSWPWRPP
jgi:hypothetical protein